MKRARGAWLVAALVACAPTPVPRPGAYHGSDADVTVTRLAHAGVLLELDGQRLLIDPWFHSGLLVRQREALGLHPDALPAASAVLLTHGAGTHLDPAALRRLALSVPRIVAPPPLEKRLTALGFREVTALAWWEDIVLDGIRVTAVPARGCGYVLRGNDLVVYAAGEPNDTTPLGDVRRAAGAIDVVLLPIGERRAFGVRRDMGPGEAATAAATLDARRVIPIAYGAAGIFPFVTFTGEPVARFRAAAAAAGIAPEHVIVLEPGESWHFSP